MARLYLRKVIVTLRSPVGTPKSFSQLRVRFRCVKTRESKPNEMEVEIYNLSDQTRSELEQQNASIVLSAGYEESIETIFTGNIKKVVQSQEGPDIISKLEVADGGNAFRNARIQKGFPPGVKTRQAIEELIQSMGLSRGSIEGVPNSQYANGLSLSGLARDRLDDLCRKNNLQWSIQNGSVQIVPNGGNTLDAPNIISPDTGLIGSPNKTKKGVEFKTLLQPKLIPGRRIQLKSRFISGNFKLGRVTHNGDSQSGDFLTECEAVA